MYVLVSDGLTPEESPVGKTVITSVVSLHSSAVQFIPIKLSFARPMRHVLLLLTVCVTLCTIALSQGSISSVRTILDINQPEGFAIEILSPGDFNRDGWPDIIASSEEWVSNTTNVIFGGPKILDDQIDVKLRGDGPMAMGDFNGDHLPDLVLYDHNRNPYGQDTILIYFGCGTGRYMIDTIPSMKIALDTVTDYIWMKIIAADLNKDGYDDLVVRTHMGDRPSRSTGKVHIWMGGPVLNDTPTFAGQRYIERTLYGTEIHVGDVNGDGYPDLCVGSTHGYPGPFQYLDIYYGGPDFRFDSVHPDQHLDSRDLMVQFPYDAMMTEFSILDCNYDGIDDLYCPDSKTGQIYYGSSLGFRNTPDRIMRSPNSSVYTVNGMAWRIGDVNGDGYVDFAIGADYYNSGCLLIYLGGIHGLSEYPCAAAGHPKDGIFGFHQVIALGDIDGDGVNDFCTRGNLNITGGYYYIRIMSGSNDYIQDAIEPVMETGEGLTALAYPNPFQGNVIIQHSNMNGLGRTTLTIYNMYGEVVRHLEDVASSGGMKQTVWDGRNSENISVSAGVYYCLVQSGGMQRKVMLVMY